MIYTPLCFGQKPPSATFASHEISPKIIIDPGHGGNDLGCMDPEKICCEKVLSLELGEKLKQYLSSNSSNEVILTRTSDEEMSLNDRIVKANKYSGDLFISLHFNQLFASNLSEIQIYVTSFTEEELLSSKTGDESLNQEKFLNQSKELAITLKKTILLRDFPYSVRFLEMPIYILKRINMPAILIEVGFLSNSEYCNRLKSEEFQNQIAMLLGEGLMTFLKIRNEGNE